MRMGRLTILLGAVCLLSLPDARLVLGVNKNNMASADNPPEGLTEAEKEVWKLPIDIQPKLPELTEEDMEPIYRTCLLPDIEVWRRRLVALWVLARNNQTADSAWDSKADGRRSIRGRALSGASAGSRQTAQESISQHQHEGLTGNSAGEWGSLEDIAGAGDGAQAGGALPRGRDGERSGVGSQLRGLASWLGSLASGKSEAVEEGGDRSTVSSSRGSQAAGHSGGASIRRVRGSGGGAGGRKRGRALSADPTASQQQADSGSNSGSGGGGGGGRLQRGSKSGKARKAPRTGGMQLIPSVATAAAAAAAAATAAAERAEKEGGAPREWPPGKGSTIKGSSKGLLHITDLIREARGKWDTVDSKAEVVSEFTMLLVKDNMLYALFPTWGPNNTTRMEFMHSCVSEECATLHYFRTKPLFYEFPEMNQTVRLPDSLFLFVGSDRPVCGPGRHFGHNCRVPSLSLFKRWPWGSKHEDLDLLAPYSGDNQPTYSLPWEQKIKKGLMRTSRWNRGSHLGPSPRETLAVAWYRGQHRDVLDAGLVNGLNIHDTYNASHPDPSTRYQAPMREYVDMADHARYQYLLHTDGITASYRLFKMMRTNSAVLKMKSDWQEWFYRALTPGKHYMDFFVNSTEDVYPLLQHLLHTPEGQATGKKLAAESQAFSSRFTTLAGKARYWRRLLSEVNKFYGGSMEECISRLPGGGQPIPLDTLYAECGP